MQLNLLDALNLPMLSSTPAPPAKPRRPRPALVVKVRPSIADRFETFHTENPHVLAEMLRLARARLDRGETWISVKALWEELRVSLSTNARDGYRLNNSFTALYSRTLLETEPRLQGVIETRRRKAR